MNTSSSINMLFLLLLPVALLFGAPVMSEAKSVTWDGLHASGATIKYFTQTNSYFQSANNYRGYVQRGLPENISVRYEATARDAGSGTILADGATISVGTEIEFVPKSFENQDISLTGEWTIPIEGIWSDSVASVSTTCNADRWYSFYEGPATGVGDTIGGSMSFGPRYDLFLDSVFVRPNVSYIHSGTATLNCNLREFCTVVSGVVNSSVVFAGTQARFYEREGEDNNAYYAGPAVTSGCRGDNTPINITPQALANGDQSNPYSARMCYISPTNVSAHVRCQTRDTGAPYTLNVPEQQINFSFTVTGSTNQSPDAPAITGPTSGTPNSAHSFNFQAADPDGDQVRYGIDWDENGSIDQWAPATGYVNSNTSQSRNRTWNTEGSYTFQARTLDSNGAMSGWTKHTINIATPPTAVADLTINSSDGPLTVENRSANQLGHMATQVPALSTETVFLVENSQTLEPMVHTLFLVVR